MPRAQSPPPPRRRRVDARTRTPGGRRMRRDPQRCGHARLGGRRHRPQGHRRRPHHPPRARTESSRGRGFGALSPSPALGPWERFRAQPRAAMLGRALPLPRSAPAVRWRSPTHRAKTAERAHRRAPRSPARIAVATCPRALPSSVHSCVPVPSPSGRSGKARRGPVRPQPAVPTILGRTLHPARWRSKAISRDPPTFRGSDGNPLHAKKSARAEAARGHSESFQTTSSRRTGTPASRQWSPTRAFGWPAEGSRRTPVRTRRTLRAIAMPVVRGGTTPPRGAVRCVACPFPSDPSHLSHRRSCGGESPTC